MLLMIQSKQVEAFRAVMQAGGMTAAADIMNITQPAVSRLIRDLERTIGLTLFRRTANQVIPTAQAHALLEQVERSFVGLQRIEAFANDLRSGPAALLRVATLPAMAAFLARFSARFCRGRPRLRLVVDSLASPLIREQVTEGIWDLGVCSAPFKSIGLISTTLEDQAVAVIPAHHPMARLQTVHVTDLAGQDVILIDKFLVGRHPLELGLQTITLGRVYETPLSTIACAMVSEGAGIAIVDPFAASEFLGRGVVIRPFAPAVIVGAAVIRPGAGRLSPAAQEFHDAFIDHARAFIADSGALHTP